MHGSDILMIFFSGPMSQGCHNTQSSGTSSRLDENTGHLLRERVNIFTVEFVEAVVESPKTDAIKCQPV